jgi:hypothetical protein
VGEIRAKSTGDETEEQGIRDEVMRSQGERSSLFGKKLEKNNCCSCNRKHQTFRTSDKQQEREQDRNSRAFFFFPHDRKENRSDRDETHIERGSPFNENSMLQEIGR